MVSFTLRTGIALLASLSLVAAAPFTEDAAPALEVRQEQMPPECSPVCSPSTGWCPCLSRPTNCVSTYLTHRDETCVAVVDLYQNFTAIDLVKWNPELGRSCFGLLADIPLCVGVTGYSFQGPIRAGAVYTPEQLPTPLQPDIVSSCTKFAYTDKAGKPGLPALLKEHGITQAQWNQWNWNGEAGNLWASFFSCVAA